MTTRRNLRFLTTTSWLAMALCAAVGAPAALAAETTATAEDDSVLQEVVVTARRRTETLRDAPVSVSAFDGSRLEASGQVRVKDIAQSVPNFTISDAGSTNSNTTIVIRGISTNARNAGFEAGVGVYVDGVFTGRPASFNQDLVDIERLEVLRGPQGTLYGKNTIAGAVNIYTVKPSYEPGGRILLETGNYDLFTARGAANLVLSPDRLAVRVSGFGKTRDGYVTNVLNGAKYNNDDAIGGRLQIRWDPTDNVAVNASADYVDEDRRHSFAEVLGDPAAPGPRTTVNDAKPFEERTLWGASNTVDIDLGELGKLSLITAYRHAKTRVGNDNDNTGADVLLVDFKDGQEQVSQEIRLVSGGDTRLSYVVGLYLYSQEATALHRGIFGRDFPLTGGRQVFIDGVAKVDTQSYAAYTDLQFDVTPKFSLLAGVRATREEKDLVYRQDGQLLPGVIFEAIPTITDKLSDSDLSASVGARYKITSDATAYVRYARGYKSGGWNADFIGSSLVAAAKADGVFNGSDIDFAPESVDNFEFGLKASWLERRLTTNLAVFRMNYDNLQVSQFLGVLNGGTVITNAGKAEITGAEFELTARPTGDLRLDLALGYLDAEFKTYRNCTPTLPSCAGNRLTDAPEWSASGSIEHTFRDWSFAEVTSRVEVSYRDDVFATPANEARLHIGSYTLLNASITVTPRDKPWSLTFWGRNLTDEDYLVGVINDDLLGTGRTFGGYGAPRTYGVRVGFEF